LLQAPNALLCHVAGALPARAALQQGFTAPVCQVAVMFLHVAALQCVKAVLQ